MMYGNKPWKKLSFLSTKFISVIILVILFGIFGLLKKFAQM